MEEEPIVDPAWAMEGGGGGRRQCGGAAVYDVYQVD